MSAYKTFQYNGALYNSAPILDATTIPIGIEWVVP